MRPRAVAITWLFKIIPVCASWPEFQWNSSTLCLAFVSLILRMTISIALRRGSRFSFELKSLIFALLIANSCILSYAEKIASFNLIWCNEPCLHNYLLYFLIFNFLRKGHQTEFWSWVFTADRMEQRMVTGTMDREVAGSRQPCILCFFIYRFTGSGAEVGDTESGEDGGRLGSTKVHFIFHLWSVIKCGN